jgi:hypothetical protein
MAPKMVVDKSIAQTDPALQGCSVQIMTMDTDVDLVLKVTLVMAPLLVAAAGESPAERILATEELPARTHRMDQIVVLVPTVLLAMEQVVLMVAGVFAVQMAIATMA